LATLSTSHSSADYWQGRLDQLNEATYQAMSIELKDLLDLVQQNEEVFHSWSADLEKMVASCESRDSVIALMTTNMESLLQRIESHLVIDKIE